MGRGRRVIHKDVGFQKKQRGEEQSRPEREKRAVGGWGAGRACSLPLLTFKPA